MIVAEGSTLAHFRIAAKLGEGGMGEVWRATDAKLDRQVALKVLPEEMASDPERLERFEREAKAIAALNHSNIVTIYSVEEADGIKLLTMELVEGKSLDQIQPAAGFELDRLFPLAIQIADALAAAHEKGIVHRDLKPANVMVTDDGRVKVREETVRRGSTRGGRSAAGWIGAIAVVGLAAALGGWWMRGQAPVPSATWSQFTQLTDEAGAETGPALSPDGGSFAYASRATGSWDIYVQRVGGRTATKVAADPERDECGPRSLRTEA